MGSGRPPQERLGRTRPGHTSGTCDPVVRTTVKIWIGVLLLAAAGIALFLLRIGTTATINWTDVRQSIDGFRGSSADFLTSFDTRASGFLFHHGRYWPLHPAHSDHA